MEALSLCQMQTLSDPQDQWPYPTIHSDSYIIVVLGMTLGIAIMDTR